MFRDQLWPTAGSDCKIRYKIIKSPRNVSNRKRIILYIICGIYFTNKLTYAEPI